MKLTVVMPVYNEIHTIDQIVDRVQRVPVDKEIIIIDNCSTDGTRQRAQQLAQHDGIRLILQQRNMQKGNSVKKGIAAAEGDYIIIQDADLEYDPADYSPLLEAAENEATYAVIGSRVAGARSGKATLGGGAYAIGRTALNWLFRLLYRSALTDIASCYKLAGREAFQSLQLQSDGFDLDYEIAAKWVKRARTNGKEIAEVPISYRPRSVQEGKKITWRDGIAALWAILKFRFTA